MNRNFSFDNFYLEIVWVRLAEEIKSDTALPTGLWTKANFRSNAASPFGLCLDNTEEANALFENAFPCQPTYFPPGMTIDILNNHQNLKLPWTFRLPFKRDRQKRSKFPKHKTR